ncbi:MAG: carboxypeptidase regulatory-like domain-containing protein, partial [Bryobacterales bacterium]|nr:carboxypeptidase regulatory-like domain-containing protein [Bryobacterales bacterium]
MNSSKFALLMMLCLPVLSYSQTVAGQVSGLVVDASGAAVPGVVVTVTDLDRAVTVTGTSTDAGFYVVTPVPPGRYRVSTEKQGFRSFLLEPLPIATQQKATVNITLEVGSVSESVTVAGSAQLIETSTATLSGVVENKRIIDLPLNGRNFTQLASLLPNAITSTSGTVGATMVTVSGGRQSKTEFLLDGISINEQLFDGVALRPSVDAIQEFKVQANSFSAEFGRGNAVLNATIKGGTNELHGSIYEFLRNDKFDARNFFLARKAAYRQNQFGTAVGGPIRKDKDFFFLNYEGLRVRQGRAFNPVVPSAAFRRGDFSSIATPVRDPLTGDPFPGNIIPANRINPATNYFQQFIPEANTPQGTFSYAAPFSDTQNQGNA